MNLLLFRELQYSVDSFGLTGLDKLLSFMIVKELQVRSVLLKETFLIRNNYCKLPH